MKIKIKHDGPHKYIRGVFKQSGTLIFRCGLPGCPHFLYEPLIVGKISVYWRCDLSFIVTQKTTKYKKFHCEDCTRGKFKNIPSETVKVEINQVTAINVAIEMEDILEDINRIASKNQEEQNETD